MNQCIRIASWNVNSIRARFDHLRRWLVEVAPGIDVCLLQELKTEENPEIIEKIGEFGFTMAMHGQKSHNGVAILSRIGIEDVRYGLPGDEGDQQARYIEAIVGGSFRVASIYLPNGNPVQSERFPYKLAWMDRLTIHARNLLALEECLIMGGDYNVIPSSIDCVDPEAWRDDAAARMETRLRWRKLIGLGFTDAVRACDTGPGIYSFWDYQRRSWERDDGIRIDHFLLSPQAADLLDGAGIDATPRDWQRPSDHCPVWCALRKERSP